MEILGGPRLEACRLYVNLICKILALLITQGLPCSLTSRQSSPLTFHVEPESRNGPPATPLILLSVATNRQHPVDMEDFSGLVAVALAYLTHESFQTYILAGLPLLLTAFSMSYTHFDPSQASDPDDAAQLRAIRQSFVPVLADISALPDFIPGSAQGGLGLLSHPVFQTLQSWLHGPPAHANLQAAACLALGNLARSDAVCTALVRDAQIHNPLADLLVRCTTGDTPLNAQLTHAVLSFLKNLAIPAANKPLLGRLLETGALPRLWSTWGDGQPQTQFAAVSFARLLLVGCPPNVRRLCAPLSPDPDSPAHDRSNLHILTALFERSDAEPTKMEVARAVATVCRILHSTPVSPVLPEEPLRNHHAPKRQRHDTSTSSGGADDSTIFVKTDILASPTSNHAISPSESLPGAPIHSPSFSLQQSPASSSSASAHSSAGSTTNNNSLSHHHHHGAGPSRRARFYAAHDLAVPLSFLIKQTRFPALRSEAWFVLALMCRSPDGATVVQAALQSFEACRALVESVTGRDMADGHDLLLAASSSPPADGQEDGRGDGRNVIPSGGGGDGADHNKNNNSNNNSHLARRASSSTAATLGIEGLGLGALEPQQVDPATQASMARIDRENGLCMVAELVRNHAADLLPLRRNIYEQLLLTGGELVLHARDDAAAGAGAGPGSNNSSMIAGMGSDLSSPGQQQQQQQQHMMSGMGMGMGMGMGGGGGGGYGPDWNTQ